MESCRASPNVLEGSTAAVFALRVVGNSPSGFASRPDCFFHRFAREERYGPHPENTPGDSARETRIVATRVSLLAVFDAPPAFIAHRARWAPVPQALPRFALILTASRHEPVAGAGHQLAQRGENRVADLRAVED